MEKIDLKAWPQVKLIMEYPGIVDQNEHNLLNVGINLYLVKTLNKANVKICLVLIKWLYI